MTLDWAALDLRARRRDLDGVTRLLLEATEDERRAFAGELEARVRAVPEESFWAGSSPAPGYVLAGIGCLPSPARAAALLCRRDIRDSWDDVPIDRFLELARARELPWIGDLGVRLARNISGRDPWPGQWAFASALLEAAGVAPPVTEGVVRSWLRQMHQPLLDEPSVPLVQRLRDSPHLDLLLPAVFDIDGVGSELTSGGWVEEQHGWDSSPRFPAAVAQLVAEGRLDRRTIVDATVDRLVRGDRPARLRPFALLHESLAPTVDELAEHALDYARLLPDAPPAIASLGQRALRALDDAGRLELETLLEVSVATLVRPEKALVKAQLSWLEKVARREPDRRGEVFVGVAVAFGHPALDVQDRALSLISRRVTGLDAATTAQLAEAAGGLAGDLPARAAALFRAEVRAAEPSVALGLPALPAPAVLPPAITGAAELAEEVVALLHDETAVGWERVLAAIVALRSTSDRSALTAMLGPVLDRYSPHFDDHGWSPQSRFAFLGEALRVLVAPAAGDRGGRVRKRMGAMLRAVTGAHGSGHDLPRPGRRTDILALRLTELSVNIATPVPMLVSTPTLVTGSLHADVLLERLRRAEEEGWQPWPLDLEQALLRVPREVDGDVLTRASALRSPAGQQFAEWLATGGMPDPVSTRFEQQVKPDDGLGYSTSPPHGTRRIVVNLQPARAGRLRLEDRLGTLRHRPVTRYWSQDSTEVADGFTMVLPHHREVVAAWALPSLAGLADSDARGGATVLPLLTECSGPIGPAMSLALGYVLGARHESDRVAGVDAFLALAAGDERFAATLGTDLGNLCGDGTVKLSRVVPALGEAYRAGAAVAVWEVATTALPLLLPTAPRGIADLLEVATRAAGVLGARDEIPELALVAGRAGSSRLVKEARRLQGVLGR